MQPGVTDFNPQAWAFPFGPDLAAESDPTEVGP
jgi:hypothetical protein